MLLTFSKERFVDSIKAGQKIHSIRKDPQGRWRPGMKIHMWKGNPRNVLKDPYQFDEKEVVSIQEIIMKREDGDRLRVFVDGRELVGYEVVNLALNDGLNEREFRVYFLPPGQDSFVGRIIHWTDKIY